MIRPSFILALKNLLSNSISPIIYFSMLKPTIQWVLVCWWCSTSISISNYKACLLPPQETHNCKESVPISSFHYPLEITNLLSVPTDLSILDILFWRDHITRGLLCLAPFKVYPYCGTYQKIPYCWKFHGLEAPHFIYSSLDGHWIVSIPRRGIAGIYGSSV